MGAEKKLRSGFTTGTCAAGAAKAAAIMLLKGKKPDYVKIQTPKGTEANLPLFHVVREEEKASCAVKKDAGDDPDVTDQTLIFASVEIYRGEEKPWFYRYEGNAPLYLTGGEGIGKVTKPGLACPPGKPAINPVPRQMIFRQVDEVMAGRELSYPLLIRIWAPQGADLAQKTFNPRLGIVGGISILGTTGVVEPMSEAALMATISLEIHMKAVEGVKRLILTPGNYGETFVREQLGFSLDFGIQCSNFAAWAVEAAAKEGIQEVLFVGHAGKLIKVAVGMKNTHSKFGDGRMEAIWSFARNYVKAEEKEILKKKILESNTTEEAAVLLRQAGILLQTMADAAQTASFWLEKWSGNRIKAETVFFSQDLGLLGKSRGADSLIERLKGQTTEQERKEREYGESEQRNFIRNRSGAGRSGAYDFKGSKTDPAVSGDRHSP